MNIRFVVVVLILCMANSVFAFNDGLGSVSFDFDNIPCGEGNIKSVGLASMSVESDYNKVPVLAQLYFKDGKSPLDFKYSPFDWFASLSYYKEKVHEEDRFTLVGYIKRYFLGEKEDEIINNYNKIYFDLKQSLGNEDPLSFTKGTPDMQMLSSWYKKRIKSDLVVTLGVVKINNLKYASIETTCKDEHMEALVKEENIKKQKKELKENIVN